MSDATVDKYDPKTWDDAALLTELRKRYEPPTIPPCRVCGGELSPQRMGGGEPTIYACSGYEADPNKPGHFRRAAGRGMADQHYKDSEHIDYRQGGDDAVMELMARFGKPAKYRHPDAVRVGQVWSSDHRTVIEVGDGPSPHVSFRGVGCTAAGHMLRDGSDWRLVSEAPDEASR